MRTGQACKRVVTNMGEGGEEMKYKRDTGRE
jgi:hypothetical protein